MYRVETRSVTTRVFDIEAASPDAVRMLESDELDEEGFLVDVREDDQEIHRIDLVGETKADRLRAGRVRLMKKPPSLKEYGERKMRERRKPNA
jgi:hypothetical protein